MLTDNAEKRVIFPSGKQRQFLLKAVKKSKLSWRQFADTIKVHKRTLNDWKRERYSLPLIVLQRISRITKLKIPADIEIRQPFWSAKKAGKVAGKLVYQKYGRIGGDPEYRKKKWYEWWERVGRFNPNKYFVTKKITLPQKNTELAEFVGILLGDGSITPNQIAISLNRFDERDFVLYIESLI